MSVATPDRLREVVRYYLEHGEKQARKAFGLTAETLARYRRAYTKIEDDYTGNALLLRIKERFSESELRAMAESGAINPRDHRAGIINFDGEEHTFLVISDTHIGHVCFDERYLMAAFEEGEKRGAEFAVHTGDVTEGMSSRAGHVYELTHLGYDRQKEYASELLGRWGKPLYLIDGNHDRWYVKANGAVIVKDIAERLPNAQFLGHDIGRVYLNGAEILLWHGEDGSSYATSYRPQKILEAMTADQVPEVLIAGHAHKQLHNEIRECQTISAGCIEQQTDWMRSKRMEAHVGFYVVRLAIADGKVKWIEPRWYPIREVA